MLEPILTIFFSTVIYLALYVVIPKENPLRQGFLLMVFINLIFLSAVGMNEAVTGASEESMGAHYIIVVVFSLIVFILYTFTVLFSMYLSIQEAAQNKKGRKDKIIAGMRF